MTTNAIIPKLKYVNSENMFSVYSNQTGVSITNFDIKLMFCQIDTQIDQQELAGGQTKELPVNKLGSVTMSPNHAKLVCTLLQGKIEEYEKLFGKINMAPTQAPASAKG
jgi:hypothetical protein